MYLCPAVTEKPKDVTVAIIKPNVVSENRVEEVIAKVSAGVSSPETNQRSADGS